MRTLSRRVIAGIGLPSLVVAGLIVRHTHAQVQEAYLKPAGLNSLFGDVNANLGEAVAVSGDTLVVGAPRNESTQGAPDAGAAYVYERDSATGQWTAQARLDSALTLSAPRFGGAVAIDGDTLVAGAEFAVAAGTEAGAAFVFERDTAGAWQLRATLLAETLSFDMGFGAAATISGDTIAVGVPRADDLGGGFGDDGAVHVFVRTPTGNWARQAVLTASNQGTGDRFGGHVAIDGDTLVVGAAGEDSNATGVNGDGGNNLTTSAGAAYVFTRSGSVWTQQAYLKASNTGFGDAFGTRVAIAGDRVVVGVPGEDNVDTADDNAGAAYVFGRDPATGTWTQEAFVKPAGAQAGDAFGSSVAIAGNTIAVGATGEDVLASNEGAVFWFTRDAAGTWTERGRVWASNAGTGDRFGAAAALSGDTLVVGAPGEDSEDGSPTNDDAPDSGAGYVIVLPDTTPDDTTPPEVVAPDDRLDVEATGLLTDVALGTASVTDDSGASLTATPDPAGPFPLGETEVTWSATDGAGNVGTDVQLVRVVDTTAPVVTAPPDIVAYEGDAVTLGVPTVIEAVGVATETNDWTGGAFPIGDTTVTWTVTDTSGNSGTDTQVVSVRQRLDLDVAGFRVTGRVRLSRGESVAFTVKIKNQGGNRTDTGRVTIVGTMGGSEVHRVVVDGVTDPPGGGATDVPVPPFTPAPGTPAGNIAWQLLLDDGNVDVDTAVATTKVVP
ncbi:MAG: HYR domain-containing protein [Vicinamibacterales bacterium]